MSPTPIINTGDYPTPKNGAAKIDSRGGGEIKLRFMPFNNILTDRFKLF
jgi:hypothetical protein